MGTPQSMVCSKIKKNIIIFHLKINIFAVVKYCCILHGHVCAMQPVITVTSPYKILRFLKLISFLRIVSLLLKDLNFFFLFKHWQFSFEKKSNIYIYFFFFFAQNIDCVNLLEPSH